MNWQSQIPGCFGSLDDIFGSHFLDRERARKMLDDASSAGASIQDIANEAEKYLKGKGATQQHINHQIDRMKLVENWI